ncbi:MAG: methyl-accepting chemotaxis protein [Sedimentibacter sp.]|uniref:methyl-accepting chemotaxis protein n=1 Tax=Sedimentibacter sp. TaxID=1960295 RepID=UPI002980FCC6|nr:methyl-accepting chemotaxis protein [Sedimentibacter sp.]MDW5299814.1 methyl-accepting chemotaxis protein [Sedimentibacter sp.]
MKNNNIKKDMSNIETTNSNNKQMKSISFIRKKSKDSAFFITNKNSIKSKIFLSFISLILVVVLILGGISAYQSYRITFDILERTMNNIAQVSSESIENELDIYRAVADNIGLNQQLSDMTVNNQQKAKILTQITNAYTLLDAYTTNAEGKGESPITKEVYMIGNTDYFISSMSGSTVVTEPKMNDKFDEVTFTVSAPLWEDGVYGSKIVGAAVIVLDGKALSDVVSSVKVGEGGFAYILDKDGYTIAHPVYEKVIESENIIKSYEEGGVNKQLAEVEQKMMSMELDFGNYEQDGQKNLIAYSCINESDGWGLFISAPRLEYTGSTNLNLLITLVVSVLALFLSYIIGKNISDNIASPIVFCAERLNNLAKGDLHTEIPRTTRDDEIGKLIKSLSSTVKGLNVIINDISFQLGAIADGNFSNKIESEYNGDFNSIVISMKQINSYLNHMIKQVDESAEQVACGSEQLAGGAQALSQGATEQASSVQELSATISEITEQINNNALNAGKARQASLDSVFQVENSSNYVKEMNDAMSEINKTSKEIEKIIKVIDNIAFQTNILALNASVEAARAGVAGNGFAVVANEVKNLALKSAEAAKNTEELIENSLIAVEKGTKVAAKTNEALSMAVEKSKVVEDMIKEITEASSQQAEAVGQVLLGVEQISSIVQTNSATAQESAAASEELSSQAQIMKELVEKIKLADGLTSGTVLFETEEV